MTDLKTSGISTCSIPDGYLYLYDLSAQGSTATLAPALHRVPPSWFTMKNTEDPPGPGPLTRHIVG